MPAARALLIAVVAVLLMPAAASAQVTLTVTTTDDHTDQQLCTPADCTLREAAMQAGTPDTIDIPAGMYSLTQGEIALLGETVIGAGARTTIIDGAPSSRVLRIGPEGGAVQITGVTVTGGAPVSGAAQPQGGGIFIGAGASLVLVDSAVVGNSAPVAGGIMATGPLAMARSTVAGNVATSGSAGGIGVASGVTALIVNSTISGNTSQALRLPLGGGVLTQGNLTLDGVTVTNNRVTVGGLPQATGGGGLYQAGALQGGPTPVTTIRDSILAGNPGRACDGDTTIIAAWAGDHDLDDDGTCGFSAIGDKPGVTPLLGPLQNNGGPTDTHALPFNSPAIDGGDGANCTATDQRIVPRPAGACDMGAFEYVAPRLTVVKRVVNDNGGTRSAGNFTVHVRQAGADVVGSPKPGSATGTTYTLSPGTYTVSEDATSGYAAAISGACTSGGVVTLAEGQAKTCTITNDDIARAASQQLPPPVPGKNVNALPKTGTVRVKLPGTDAFVLLDEDEQIPLGTIVDVRKGRVTIVAAAGEGQTADFYGGLFKLGQTKGSKPITVLTLVERLSCPKKQASAAAKKKRKRRLWGDGKGRFRTKGKHSAATVVGTKWLVEDKCASTLTRVVRGKVRVRDFVKKKTVLVKTGKKYVARRR